MLEGESQIAPAHQLLSLNGRLLNEYGTTVGDYGINDGDMLLLTRKSSQTNEQLSKNKQPAAVNAMQDTEMVRLQILGDPRLMTELKQTQPALAQAVNNPTDFARELQEVEQKRQTAEREKQVEMERLHDDPFDEESQRKIEEIIRQEAVMENLQSALEHTPEGIGWHQLRLSKAFGRVTMLYVDVEVNSVRVKAFVDSGAQTTISILRSFLD